MHTYISTYIRAYAQMHMHTCIHAYMHTCIRAYMHTCIHAYVHTCIHAYIQTYRHTHIHTYTHTHILSRAHLNGTNEPGRSGAYKKKLLVFRILVFYKKQPDSDGVHFFRSRILGAYYFLQTKLWRNLLGSRILCAY